MSPRVFAPVVIWLAFGTECAARAQTAQTTSAVATGQQPSKTDRGAVGHGGLVGARTCIAHAGSSASAPPHTLAAYRRALAAGADYIEPDLQLTHDGVLVCLHDPALERTTDVEEVFPDRAREVQRAGEVARTWLVVDFTLAEIKRLDAGSWFDPAFAGEPVATLQELIDLVKGKAGIYPETKNPELYRDRGLDIDEALHRVLVSNGLDTVEGQRLTPVLIQSFHASSLKKLRQLGGTSYSLVQLVWIDQFDDYLSEAGLDSVATYAQAVGPFLSLALGDRTLVRRAHERGLAVHAWQLFEAFPPEGFADEAAYIRYLFDDVGLDGLFVHSPELCP